MFIDMFHIQMQLMQILDQWNEYACMYVCMCVCMYVYMYVFFFLIWFYCLLHYSDNTTSYT